MEIKTKEFFYISNILSLSRIVLIIPIAFLIQLNTQTGNLILVILVMLTVSTDYFDGVLSRKLNQVTDLGKILDPIADKLAMGIILIFLVIYRNFPVSLVIFLLYRDLVILIFGYIILKKINSPHMANFWGKLNTTVISLLGIIFLLNIKNVIYIVLLFCSYLTILISGVSYFMIAEKILYNSKIKKYLFRLSALVITLAVIFLAFNINWAKQKTMNKPIRQFETNEGIIKKYAPIFYSTKNEVYLPTQTESFLDNSKFMKRSKFLFFDKEISHEIDKRKLMSEYNSNVVIFSYCYSSYF